MSAKNKLVLLLAILMLCSLAAFATGSEEAARPNVVRFAIAEESRGLDPVTAHRRFSEAAVHVHDALAFMDHENNV